MKKKLVELLSRKTDYYKNLLIEKYGVFNFKKPVVLFGAAKMAYIYINLCKKNNIKILAICDNDNKKVGKFFGKKKVISLSELLQYPKDTQIIITSIFDEEIRKQLVALGFSKAWSHAFFSTIFSNSFYNPTWQNSIEEITKNKKNIIKCFEFLKDKFSQKTYLELIKYRLFLDRKHILRVVRPIEKIYFEKNIIKKEENEVFIDGGAYFGESTLAFIDFVKNKYKSIHVFEPDTNSYKKLSEKIRKIQDKRIKLYPFGIGKKEAELQFTNDGTSGSRIGKGGNHIIKVISLDKYLLNEKVTTIKFDIEGAEIDALYGCKKIICRYKPKLAICIYHRFSDFWEIPLLIKKFVPSYNFFLRHYTPYLYDSILYAV